MKIKRCPFCQSRQLEVMQVMSNTFVQCQQCGARGPIAHHFDGALNAWNKRKVTTC